MERMRISQEAGEAERRGERERAEGMHSEKYQEGRNEEGFIRK